MKKYHSGYYLEMREERFTPEEYSKKEIKHPELSLVSSNYIGQGWHIEWEFNNYWNGLEFIIAAKSFDIAQEVLYNVFCSCCLINASLTYEHEPHFAHEFGTIDKVKMKNSDVINNRVDGFCDNLVHLYFHIACLASQNCKIANSIVKYQLSAEIYSQNYKDIHEEITWKTTDYTYVQMRFAYAIIAAYSIIEELGLHVNVNKSKDHRSILDNGEWDPAVLDDLINRLKLANIKIEEDIPWLIRGDATKIETNRPIKTTKAAEWADPPDYKDEFFIKIKDGYVFLPDSINHISFLRSRIASHSVGERIKDLSVFDVANAQYLSRRLILESIGLWILKHSLI